MISGRNLGILGLATAVVLAAALWVSGSRAPGELPDDQGRVFPSLGEAVDEVSRITLTRGGGTIVATLERGDGAWMVAEKDGYPADSEAVRKLLIQLTDTEILEAKTAKPDLYGRLGVRDIGDEEAEGVLVTLAGPSRSWSLIVGKTAAQAGGTFARRPEEAGSLLLDGQIDLPTDVARWLDREIMDIPAQRIHAVSITQPDGTGLELSKSERGQTNFDVAGLPDGRELQSAAAANSIGGTLAGLRLEDVRGSADVPADAVVTEIRTFDGLVISARLFEDDGADLAAFEVAFDESLAQRFQPVVEAESADDADAADTPADASSPAGESGGADEGTEPASAEEPAPEDVLQRYREEAQTLQQRVSGWVYELPTYKFGNLTKRLDDLLEPLAGGDESDTN